MALKDMREREGYTQVELAELTGLNPAVIRFYESGYRDINGAKLATLLKLCEALSCDLDDILTDEYTLKLLEEYIINREAAW